MRIEGTIIGVGVGSCPKCGRWFSQGQRVVAERVSTGDTLGWNIGRLVHQECLEGKRVRL